MGSWQGLPMPYFFKPFLSEFCITQLLPKLVQGISSGFQSPCFKLFQSLILIKITPFFSPSSTLFLHNPPFHFLGRMDCLTNFLALHPEFSRETLNFLCRSDSNTTLNPLTEIHLPPSSPQPTIQVSPKRSTGNSTPLWTNVPTFWDNTQNLSKHFVLDQMRPCGLLGAARVWYWLALFSYKFYAKQVI
jgi:hypothetical protein